MALSPDQRRRLLRMNMLMAYASFASSKAVAWTPATLFANAEVGGWYDPSDLSTLFQDAAGTTPVSAVEQPVGLVLDKSGRGNHLSQSTSTARPVLSARVNLLVNTATLATQSVTTVATTYTLAFSGAGSITLSGTATGTYSAGSNTITCTAGTLTLTVSGTVTNADLRPANAGVGLPSYQRVGAATSGTSSAAGNSDYDTTGFPLYLRFDGTDDFLVSGTISPGSVDKAQVFAGVRKLAAAGSIGIVAEMGGSVLTSGTLNVASPGGLSGSTENFSFAVNGSQFAGYDATTYTAPITSVLSCAYDIGGSALADEVKPRINGVVPSTLNAGGNANAGTGNFTSQVLNVGSRNAGTDFRFRGNLYSLILRFSATNMDAATLASTETWVNQKTRAY